MKLNISIYLIIFYLSRINSSLHTLSNSNNNISEIEKNKEIVNIIYKGYDNYE